MGARAKGYVDGGRGDGEGGQLRESCYLRWLKEAFTGWWRVGREGRD